MWNLISKTTFTRVIQRFFLQLLKHHEFIVHVPDLKPHQALKHLRPNWVNVLFHGLRGKP